MKKENFKRLCERCKKIVRGEDTENKKVYRLKIKSRGKGQVNGKIKVNKK